MGYRNIKIMSMILVSLLSLNCIFALGVSSPYWENNPLEMYPGETRDVAFTLVSKADAETEKAFVTLEENQGIAKLKSGIEYTIVPGTTDTKIILEMSIPENTAIGESYPIKFFVKSAPEGEGTVQLNVKYNVDFPVKVVKKSAIPQTSELKEEKVSTTLIIGIILAVIVIIVVLYLIIRKKKSQPVQSNPNSPQ